MTNRIPTECPYCGCTDAYEKSTAKGRVNVRYDLSERTVDYSSMWDGIEIVNGKLLYCMDCGKRIGKIEDATDFRNADEIPGYLL